MMEGMSQSNSNTKEELYAVVIGHVQGVGFRYFVVQKAHPLGIHGFVRNDQNGNVEVLAQGTRAALEQFLIVLQQGPSAAEVRDVHTTWRGITEHISGFHIRW
jgi:acylphosphatase